MVAQDGYAVIFIEAAPGAGPVGRAQIGIKHADVPPPGAQYGGLFAEEGTATLPVEVPIPTGDEQDVLHN